ncbi:hypothetical protein [uncultured Propionivibrio sp.]|uniref:hypothetical protein n=1 Tax=uncultured Propionivibrio sp. TaxID=426737 RepID=UPI0029C098A9|nr:hypothetical protein [uncultured Propionivibrio sp.]
MAAIRERMIPVLLSALLLPLCAGALEVPQTAEQAEAQRNRASAMKQAATDQYAEDKAACYKKVLVSGCLKDAKARHTAANVAARELDAPARAFQRDARRAEVEAKEAKREADAPAREAEQHAQTDEFRSKEATRAAERERKIAEKAEQAAQYRQKAAAEQKDREERQAERERRLAERRAKQASTDAATDASTRERLPK